MHFCSGERDLASKSLSNLHFNWSHGCGSGSETSRQLQIESGVKKACGVLSLLRQSWSSGSRRCGGARNDKRSRPCPDLSAGFMNLPMSLKERGWSYDLLETHATIGEEDMASCNEKVSDFLSLAVGRAGIARVERHVVLSQGECHASQCTRAVDSVSRGGAVTRNVDMVSMSFGI